MSRRIGILSFSSPGHYYPLTALGRRLGHEVVYVQVADLERPIRAAGLQFRPIGGADFPPARCAHGTRKSVSSKASPPCGAGFVASNGRR
jgi:UDP:flavonoid glycosyltransferase YjiC (YdhE family)